MLQQRLQHSTLTSTELGQMSSFRLSAFTLLLSALSMQPSAFSQECTPPFSKGPVIPSEFPNCPAQECVVNEGLPDEFRYSLYDCFMESFDEPNRLVKGETTNYIVPTYVTVPEGVEWPMPLLVMLHMANGDRNTFVLTETSDTTMVDNWNALTFARRGYAVLTLTARGHLDDPSGLPASTLNPQARWWVPSWTGDPRWDVRDIQVLIGKLVDAGLADPERIAATGNSYGGTRSIWLGYLNNKITVDYDENTNQWITEDWKAAPTKEYPDGVPLSMRAVVPAQHHPSLLYVFVPNGRISDSEMNTQADLNCPFGVVLAEWATSILSGLFPDSENAPPDTDETADFTSWYVRMMQGEPYDDAESDGECVRADEEVAKIIKYMDLTSPLYSWPTDTVPMYQIMGFTDTVSHVPLAVQMIRHLKSSNPNYPIKSFFGNLHHHFGPVKSHWDEAQRLGYEFLDYYMLDKGAEPTFDITVATTVCGGEVPPEELPPYSASTEFKSADWDSLRNAEISFQKSTAQTTINPSPYDPAFNPFANEPQANCMIVPAAPPTEKDGVASWDITMPSAFTLIGSPRLTLSFNTDASDVQLNAILWKLSSDELEKTLVTYGAYRHLGTPGKSDTVTYQILANAWEFEAGTTLRLEVRSDARPHFQPNNAPAVTDISSVTLTLPGRCKTCLADLNCDGIVNVNDLLLLISNWGTASASGDLNLSGSINVDDLLILIGAWGPCL